MARAIGLFGRLDEHTKVLTIVGVFYDKSTELVEIRDLVRQKGFQGLLPNDNDEDFNYLGFISTAAITEEVELKQYLSSHEQLITMKAQTVIDQYKEKEEPVDEVFKSPSPEDLVSKVDEIYGMASALLKAAYKYKDLFRP